MMHASCISYTSGAWWGYTAQDMQAYKLFNAHHTTCTLGAWWSCKAQEMQALYYSLTTHSLLLYIARQIMHIKCTSSEGLGFCPSSPMTKGR